MRILVVDDEQSVREAYSYILEGPADQRSQSLARQLESELFGKDAQLPAEEADLSNGAHFAVTYAKQGMQGVSLVEDALALGNPYKVAFIDIRMPPGIDGKETARRIRAIDPDINIVIVTAYSDHSVSEIAAVAGPPHKIFYLQKPFAAAEVRQMAQALVERWDHDTNQLTLLREKIVELAASEARAEHLANHDYLTGVPNRLALKAELLRQTGMGAENLYLAFIGLRRLSAVNEMYGHDAGDELLNAVVSDLQVGIPDASMLARISSDQLAVVFRSQDLESAEAWLGTLLRICTANRTIFEQSVQLSASCGLVECQAFAETEAPVLLRFAELALVEADSAGGGIVRFNADLDNSKRFRRRLEEGLLRAFDNDEFELHYQPIIVADTRTRVGYEALLRWSSPEFGSVSPAVFIPIAEECGLIDRIGNWVITRALSDARSWPDMLTSINVSPRQFDQPDWIESLARQAQEFGIQPHKIQLEITETALFKSLTETSKKLSELRAMGFRVALDDFGTGFSSMCNLKDFEVDCVKIDRSFVVGINSDKQSAKIVGAIGQLAERLGMITVAEGIENEDQFRLVQQSNCGFMQGFLFGTPKRAAECIAPNSQ